MVDKNIIRSAFLQKQNSLIADLGIAPASIRHGGAIGEASEAKWAAVLKEFLPSRYGVTKGFAIDSSGEISDQIDLLIYDSQYTPLLVRISDSDLLVPVEAVYAVFEVKQEANKRFMDYAGRKMQVFAVFIARPSQSLMLEVYSLLRNLYIFSEVCSPRGVAGLI